ncbi:MBL fold metallo-hydrolase [Rhodococcus sp. M8]|nr:hypothetical protein BKE56_012565 [Rhodococcus sp. M8]QPG44554.1 MBL fold metallo-hydrolase [Rhodococcus sp. M8]
MDGGADEQLPAWVIWRQRPFPDTNLLLLDGREAALVDSGFVGHAQQTAEWVHAHSDNRTRVVNTHWHADHVGGNALPQARGAGIAAGAPGRRRRRPTRPGLLSRRIPRPAGRPVHRRRTARRRAGAPARRHRLGGGPHPGPHTRPPGAVAAPRSDYWWSETRCPTTTSAGSTVPSTALTRPARPCNRCTG